MSPAHLRQYADSVSKFGYSQYEYQPVRKQVYRSKWKQNHDTGIISGLLTLSKYENDG